MQDELRILAKELTDQIQAIDEYQRRMDIIVRYPRKGKQAKLVERYNETLDELRRLMQEEEKTQSEL